MRTRWYAAAGVVVALAAGTPGGRHAIAGAADAARPHHTGTAGGARVVAEARRYLGIPYVWGGGPCTKPRTCGGLDCSGLTVTAYRAVGVELPRTAGEQMHVGRRVPSLRQAQPGDLLFWTQPDNHVAIYEGRGELIEAPQPGLDVSERLVYSGVVAIRRITT